MGATVELGLAHGFAVEFDAVYHRLGYYSSLYHDTLYTTYGERDNSWEFPVLLKYNLHFSTLHPLVEAGVAPRTITGRQVGTFQIDGYTLSPPSSWSSPVSYSPTAGFVAGVGLQFNLGHLRLAPQVRYTHWPTAPFRGLDEFIDGTFSSNQNQVDVLVGISWKVK